MIEDYLNDTPEWLTDILKQFDLWARGHLNDVRRCIIQTTERELNEFYRAKDITDATFQERAEIAKNVTADALNRWHACNRNDPKELSYAENEYGKAISIEKNCRSGYTLELIKNTEKLVDIEYKVALLASLHDHFKWEASGEPHVNDGRIYGEFITCSPELGDLKLFYWGLIPPFVQKESESKIAEFWKDVKEIFCEVPENIKTHSDESELDKTEENRGSLSTIQKIIKDADRTGRGDLVIQQVILAVRELAHETGYVINRKSMAKTLGLNNDMKELARLEAALSRRFGTKENPRGSISDMAGPSANKQKVKEIFNEGKVEDQGKLIRLNVKKRELQSLWLDEKKFTTLFD